MSVTERVAYLKGLAEGLGIDSDSKEGRLLSAIIDVLDDMAFELSETTKTVEELEEQIDMIDEDLDGLEEYVYDDDDDECGCGCDDEECDCDELYEAVCPSCGETIYLDADMLKDGEISCPSCGEHLEFDAEDIEEDGEEDNE